jgi:hypothetical protein
MRSIIEQVTGRTLAEKREDELEILYSIDGVRERVEHIRRYVFRYHLFLSSIAACREDRVWGCGTTFLVNPELVPRRRL